MRSSPRVMRDISSLSPSADSVAPDQLRGTASRPMRSLVAQADGAAETDSRELVRQPVGDWLAAVPF